jgi:hypothetical protein
MCTIKHTQKHKFFIFFSFFTCIFFSCPSTTIQNTVVILHKGQCIMTVGEDSMVHLWTYKLDNCITEAHPTPPHGHIHIQPKQEVLSLCRPQRPQSCHGSYHKGKQEWGWGFCIIVPIKNNSIDIITSCLLSLLYLLA